MAIFTLVFEGLICHVGATANAKTRSVLVWSPSDKPEDNHVPKIVGPGGTRFLRQHDSITFRNLPTGGPDTDLDFRLRVPTLERLLNPPGGTIRSGVASGDVDPAVGVTVALPFGNLGAPKRHLRRIKFEFHNGDTEARCVPEATVLTTVTSSSSVELVINHRRPDGTPDGDPEVLIFDSNAIVRIQNLPEAEGGNHFGHFLMLTTAANMAAVTDDGSDCVDSTIERGNPKDAKARPERQGAVPSSAYAMLVESIPSEKLRIAQESASALGQDFERATSNPECTNSGWP